jgi:hypothetical protein
MRFLAENPASSFTPSGVLKVATKEENLIEAARMTLQKISNKETISRLGARPKINHERNTKEHEKNH